MDAFFFAAKRARPMTMEEALARFGWRIAGGSARK